MRRRPHIGVPTQTLQAIDGIPPGLPHSWVMNHRYHAALESVGGVPWMIPLLDSEATIRRMYDRLDGIFLAGGVDVDPSSYGAVRSAQCGRTDLARDRVELLLARWAAQDGKPIFGVCRGMQIMNIAAGGSLFQDCATDHPDASKHDYFPTAGFARDFLAHDIEIAPGSRLTDVYGGTRGRVNSMHHQGIERLGAALLVTARSDDGLIEAIEAEGAGFGVGVQWHPEMLIDTDAATRRLFQSFIDAALAYGEARAVLA